MQFQREWLFTGWIIPIRSSSTENFTTLTLVWLSPFNSLTLKFKNCLGQCWPRMSYSGLHRKTFCIGNCSHTVIRLSQLLWAKGTARSPVSHTLTLTSQEHLSYGEWHWSKEAASYPEETAVWQAVFLLKQRALEPFTVLPGRSQRLQNEKATRCCAFLR